VTKREKTIGIVAGVVIGALALDSVILTPLLDRKALADTQLANVRRDLQSARQLISNDQRAQENWARMAGETLLDNAPGAEGQLLNATRQWAESSGLSVTTLRPERNEREQGYHKITIRVTATGSMRQASRFLYAVQTATIPVRVSDLSLAARREGTDDLTINIGLSTIYLPPASPRADATEVRR
jgi:Tfp pilus assembly protein PilO